MTENIKKLLELASTNEDLKTKLTNVSKDDFIAIAKENGIELTDADFEAPQGEISDDELNAVAGGGCWNGNGDFALDPSIFKISIPGRSGII